MFFIVVALIPIAIEVKDLIVAMRHKRTDNVTSISRAA